MGETKRGAMATGDAARPLAEGRREASASTTSPPERGELLDRLGLRARLHERYEILRPLARGGMGEILHVRDEDLRRALAVKVLRSSEREQDLRALLEARFLEEAQVTGQLEHPGVVPVHDIGLDAEGRPYFAMRWVRGRTLLEIFELVRSGAEGWTLSRALGVILKVCEAVAFAHAKGVIHRDLKPANVMVGRFGETYVMDWGLARVLGQPDSRDLRLRFEGDPRASIVATDRSRSGSDHGDSPLVTLDGEVLGTPAYMCPEQAEGRLDRLGARSDVYSLGALLYHLLGGRAPYEPAEGRIGARMVLGLLLNGPPPALEAVAPDAPPELAAICAKAMARDPAERYPDCLELARDLEAFLDRRPVRAHEPGFLHTLRLAVERNRAAAWTAGAAAALVVALVAAFVLRLQASLADARAAQEEARAASAESELRGDRLGAQMLLASAERLPPASSRRIPELSDWLASADTILARRAAAARLAIVAELAAARRRVAERIELARAMEHESLVAARAAWDRCTAAIASDERFAGLALAPQLGLVPLGPNPATGLWEFWHVASGSRPAPPHPETGLRVPRSEDGVVLALLPGGEFRMGALFDEPHSLPGERAHLARVEPFFLAVFETTQGQYLRATDGNPSRSQPVRYPDVELTHPVETVSWDDAGELARLLELRLPTETEWEYAARAGTETPWYSGAAAESLVGFENLGDVAHLYGDPEALLCEDDGFARHAPVGSYAPNAFGLHDLLGNLSEWCADWYGPYPGDAFREHVPEEFFRVFRGGNWYVGPAYARAAFRQWKVPGFREETVGVRLARSIER